MDTKQRTSKNSMRRVLTKAHFLGLFLVVAATQFSVFLDGTPRF